MTNRDAALVTSTRSVGRQLSRAIGLMPTPREELERESVQGVKDFRNYEYIYGSGYRQGLRELNPA